MRVKHLVVPALALGVAAGLATSGAEASAAGGAATTVTIKAEGVDLSGLVKSSQRKCVDGRKVIVFKQQGARGGGDDTRFASDTASLTRRGVAEWSTGNTGTAGRFYAKVRHTDGCRGDTSPTIRAKRNP